jgi:hypothetical protein
VLALIAAGVWFGRESTSGSPASTVPPTNTPTDIAQPTGCLGGSNRDADMLLTTQAQAPHTSNGAVDFAAALARWSHRFPVPSTEESERVQAAAIASEAGYDLRKVYASNPNASGGLVPDGTPFYISTVLGVWHLEEYSGNTARVSIGTGIVVNGEMHTSFRLSTMYELKWAEVGWQIVAAVPPRPTEELFELGIAFTAGC